MVGANETLYTETVHQFLTVYRYLRRYARQMHAEGVSGRKLAALRYLIEVGPLTIGQLSAYMCISDSSTSELVAKLKDSGYATRTRSQVDNRVVLEDVTSLGRELVQRTPLGGIPLLREALKTLSPDQLVPIHQAMATMSHLLEISDDS